MLEAGSLIVCKKSVLGDALNHGSDHFIVGDAYEKTRIAYALIIQRIACFLPLRHTHRSGQAAFVGDGEVEADKAFFADNCAQFLRKS